MRKLFHEHPEEKKHFQEGNLQRKKIQLTLKQLQLTSREFSAQTKHQAYATAWGLGYHEVPAISRGYGEILKSVVSNTDANYLHKELRNRNISGCNDITTQQTIFFIKERVNSYETPMPILPANQMVLKYQSKFWSFLIRVYLTVFNVSRREIPVKNSWGNY